MPMSPGDFVANAAANAVGGAALVGAAALWRHVQPFVQELRERALPQAREQFERNSEALVAAVARELGDGADSPAEADARLLAAAGRLEDPDTAVAFADALRAGGRTSHAERHAAIAKLIAARLAAASDSTQAAAANMAVRAAETLGPAHLRVLALLALVHYAGRPNPAVEPWPILPPKPPSWSRADPEPRTDEERAAAEAWHREERALVSAYAQHFVERLAERLGQVAPPTAVPDSLVLHLEAAACVLRHEHDPDLPGVLARAIGPARPVFRPGTPAATPFQRGCERAIVQRLRGQDAAFDRLAELWASSLRLVALTPAGLLIGLAAYDALTGERRVAEWEWAGGADHALTLADYRPETPFETWAGDRRFQDVVERAVGERLSDQARAAGVNTARW